MKYVTLDDVWRLRETDKRILNLVVWIRYYTLRMMTFSYVFINGVICNPKERKEKMLFWAWWTRYCILRRYILARNATHFMQFFFLRLPSALCMDLSPGILVKRDDNVHSFIPDTNEIQSKKLRPNVDRKINKKI